MPYAATPTFWIEATDEVAWGLRRYASDQPDALRACPASPIGAHGALVYLGRAPARRNQRGLIESSQRLSHGDPRWPTTCQHCDYRFGDSDRWQDWDELIYRRPADGAEFVLYSAAPATELGFPSAPPGACWDATWMPERWRGPDGSR